jgi:ribonucleoside-diphosphate reductase alpha chain
MAVSKFYKDYALKTNDGKQYLESYEDRIAIVSLYLGRGNAEKAKKYAQQMIKQNYQPATPTFLNAGRSRRGEMVSCFLLEMDDSLNSIGFNINTAMQLSKIGGGVALNLSKLRARGEEIKGIENAASGVMPVMKLLEDSFSYANQLGQRKGAGAVYLNIFHWDIVEFLD